VRSTTIAVTGVGAITALGGDAEGLWAGLCRGQRGFRPIEGFDTQGCRIDFGAEVRWVTPRGTRAAALAGRACAEAMAQSRLSRAEFGRTGLVLGSTAAGDHVLEAHLGRVGRRGRERSSDLCLHGYPKRSLVDRVARRAAFGREHGLLERARGDHNGSGLAAGRAL
jgi:3-oxoacyl-(acyl-carrier-protein) synthase